MTRIVLRKSSGRNSKTEAQGLFSGHQADFSDLIPGVFFVRIRDHKKILRLKKFEIPEDLLNAAEMNYPIPAERVIR